MTTPLIAALPGNETLCGSLASLLGYETTELRLHRFPDDETLLEFTASPRNRDFIIVSTLDRPNPKFLPLQFAAQTARELGATRVGLVAPYLAYMRQDERFSAGQAVTARLFASALSRAFDWLVTVDPHLHRIHALDDVYSIPTRTVHAAPEVAKWINGHIPNPILIGPDSESEQWVAEVACLCGAPTAVMAKNREGDTTVSLSVPDMTHWRECQPVLLDDIISTGATMAAAVRNLRPLNRSKPICVGVHAIFAQDGFERLSAEQPAEIVTSNTVTHHTNRIELSRPIAAAIASLAPAHLSVAH